MVGNPKHGCLVICSGPNRFRCCAQLSISVQHRGILDLVLVISQVMSLRDTSCYTLTLKPSASDPNVVDLLEHPDGTAGAGQPKYARLLQNAEGEAYSAVIFGKSR